MSIQKDDQVVWKRKIRSGTLVKVGSVLRVEGSTALVHFPHDHAQQLVPVTSLEKTSKLFAGYSRVTPNAVQRSTVTPKR